MKSKFWIRWFSISFIFIIYYFVLFCFNFIFAIDYSENMSMGGDFNSSQCVWFAQVLLADHNNTALVSSVGFLVCVPLILLVFKKIR